MAQSECVQKIVTASLYQLYRKHICELPGTASASISKAETWLLAQNSVPPRIFALVETWR